MLDYRALFSDLGSTAYLAHAGISPLNRRCQQAMTEVMTAYGQLGVRAWGIGNERRIRLREKCAALIGASQGDIALTPNTSFGIYAVAAEFPWEEGDALVLIRGEFPANILPWLAAAERFRLKVLWLELDDLISQNEAFEAAMAAKPRLLAVSWVQYQTGARVELAALSALRARYGVQICLDAVQGLGPLLMDLRQTPLDYVTCGGHKWLLSPEGTAFFYVHPERMAALRPLVMSWMSQQDASSFLFRGKGFVDYTAPLKTRALRFEVATLNALGLAGMEAAIDLYHEVGLAQVSARILSLARYARARLAALGVTVYPTDSGNVCIAMDAEQLAACHRAADQEGIVLTTPDGYLRIAPHFYNKEEELDRAVAVVARFAPRS